MSDANAILEDVDLSHLIFVGGSPRSGTTLVQRLLNAHPDIYGGPEIDLIPSVIKLYGDSVSKIRSGRISAWLDEDDCRRLFRRQLYDLFSCKKGSTGVSLISEKTPSNILVFSELMDLCPDANFIWVIRDPRAVIASMKQVAVRQKKRAGRAVGFVRSLATSCDYVEKCIQAGERALEGRGRLNILYYEDLVSDPASVMDDFLSSLGHRPVELNKLTETTFEAADDKASWIDWYSDEQMRQGIQNSSLEKWRSELSRREVGYVEARLSKCQILSNKYDIADGQSRAATAVQAAFFRGEAILQALPGLLRSVYRRLASA